MVRLAYRVALTINMGLLVLLVTHQVVARYVEFVPSSLWTEEVSRGFFIWMVMIGTGLGFYEDTHFSFSYFTAKLDRRKAYWVITFVRLFAVSFCAGVLVVAAIPFAAKGLDRVSLISGLPWIWSYGAVAAGSGLMALGAISNLLNAFRSLRQADRC